MNIGVIAKAFDNLLHNNDEILEMYISDEWDDFKLDRSGELTEWLTKYHPNRYHGKWNRHASSIKPEIEIYIKNLKDIVVSKDFVRCVDALSWDLLHIQLEQLYGNLQGAPLFCLSLLKPEYENGRIPYGWNGQFPEGSIKSLIST